VKTAEKFGQAFYETHIWGAIEIDPGRKGIDRLKLERLIEASDDWTGKRCLEVGCGAGRYLRALSRMLPTPDVHLAGTDISTDSIDIAESISGNIEYRLMTPGCIPWEDESFDVVCFLDVLEHIEEPVPFLAESLRVLKVGGVLHGSIPLEGDIRSLWRWFKWTGYDHAKRKDGQIQRFTRKSLFGLASQFPLRLEQEHYSYHFAGNVLDFTLFNFLALRRALGFGGSHYDIVRSLRKKRMSVSSLLARAAEWAMYTEGRLFGWLPGPFAHLTYRRLA
jgi:ubiquinone/menaquinone biosynthesis C-methylase UbiE